jgi:hypothetical protein
MKKAKAVKSKKKVANLNKQFMLSAAKCIAEVIGTEKVKQNGRVPWGYASKLLSEGRKTFPGMSRRTINNYVILLEKERKIGRTFSYVCVSIRMVSHLSNFTATLVHYIYN